jgi:hypothetical protein
VKKYLGAAIVAIGLAGCTAEDKETFGEALLGPGYYPKRCDDLFNSLYMGESLTEAQAQPMRGCGDLGRTETPSGVTAYWHFPGGQTAAFDNGVLNYKSTP